VKTIKPTGQNFISNSNSLNPMKQKQREKSWKPATEFKLTKLKPAGPKEGQSLSSYMYGRAKSDAEWRTMSDKYKETGKQQKRKPRWTIK
jgi:hypothetical protein